MGIDIGTFGGQVNIGLIVAIIGVLLTVRRIDTEKRLSRKFYIVAVLILGFGCGLLTGGSTLKEIILNGIIHAGVASILYQTGKLVATEKDFKFIHKNTELEHD